MSVSVSADAPLLRLAPPSAPLSGLVEAILVVRDLAGAHAGQPVVVAPRTGALVSVSIGRPNMADDGVVAPRAALTGLHESRRVWRSFEDCYLVIGLLTAAGTALLLPPARGTVDRVLEAGALLGDAQAAELESWVSSAPTVGSAAAAMDAWLVRRLAAAPPIDRAFLSALQALEAGSTVDAAAVRTGLCRRKLHRRVTDRLGLGPKRLAALGRLQQSLRAAQARSGDPMDGYSDQAHQIRDWRRRLEITPGRYARTGPTPLARMLEVSPGVRAPGFYV